MTERRIGFYLGCCDRKLNEKKIDRRLRETLGLIVNPTPIGETAPRRYCYPLTSAGGNSCSELPRSLRVFISSAQEGEYALVVTHAIFFKHVGCAAVRASDHIPPKDGARLFARLYSTYREQVPDVLVVPKPSLVVVRIDTHTSDILEERDISQEVWENSNLVSKEEWMEFWMRNFVPPYPELNPKIEASLN